jgi:hypothetical protein
MFGEIVLIAILALVICGGKPMLMFFGAVLLLWFVGPSKHR